MPLDQASKMTLQKLQVILINPLAKVPVRATPGSAGYDLFSVEDVVIPRKGGRYPVDTGMKLKLPEGTYGRVASRSGLAVKFGVDAIAGVIDSDYRGILKVALANNGEKDFEIKVGDRVAQLIIERIVTPEAISVESFDEEETLRGSGGFGSTGGVSAAM
ncbi:Deoxyuridine 5'-triphosphate nucleotidohydrolase [Smittium culicis]|uniref:Deoxyuridine 5'-triphosphate nucleotidohydrolase n=1 Tax=Smittium culicis TaxID=133412 RepID=A0A1R1YQE4_9FUNG|nr:Deoxyuridine 5'-triphosphate nucleotidohydrolase [Smittium culicis]